MTTRTGVSAGLSARIMFDGHRCGAWWIRAATSAAVTSPQRNESSERLRAATRRRITARGPASLRLMTSTIGLDPLSHDCCPRYAPAYVRMRLP
jgi:hypothetical protein